MLNKLIAEATEIDFKVALEVKKPKSWLKSVSAFANGIGGVLLFGVDDERNILGLHYAQQDAEAISRLIKERITPLPQFVLRPLEEKGKALLPPEGVFCNEQALYIVYSLKVPLFKRNFFFFFFKSFSALGNGLGGLDVNWGIPRPWEVQAEVG